MTDLACPTIGLIINAGGDSRRMGRNKALLPVPPDGRPLLEYLLDRLAPLAFAKITVVTNDAQLPGQIRSERPIRYVRDAFPGKGALGGIATGLSNGSGWSAVLACDMPLVNLRLLAWLCALPGREPGHWDAVVPRVGGFLQPLHAIYHVRSLPAIESLLAVNQLRIIDFLPRVRTRIVEEAELIRLDPTLASFRNANTPAEWAEILAYLPDRKGG